MYSLCRAAHVCSSPFRHRQLSLNKGAQKSAEFQCRKTSSETLSPPVYFGSIAMEIAFRSLKTNGTHGYSETAST